MCNTGVPLVWLSKVKVILSFIVHLLAVREILQNVQGAEVLHALQCDCLADGRVSNYVHVLCSDSIMGARDERAAAA